MPTRKHNWVHVINLTLFLHPCVVLYKFNKETSICLENQQPAGNKLPCVIFLLMLNSLVARIMSI